MKNYFKIGEISKLYNIGVDSLRYYEELNLISPKRGDNNYRMYSIDDIWRLNVIRELRELGFDMKKIRNYLESHTIDSSLHYLTEEKNIVNKKIEKLMQLRENVNKRMATINRAKEIQTGIITLKHYEKRNYFSISEGYENEYEMDILIKRLINMDKKHFYIIGNNQLGSLVFTDEFIKNNTVKYKSAFIFSENGDKSFESGNYLSICYNGNYTLSKDCIKSLITYAKNNSLTLKGDFLELIWTDIHTSLDEKEHITEIQVMVK